MKKPTRPGLEVAVSSEKGLRDENQDWLSWTQIPLGELFIIADGMGGYSGGSRAARMTADGIEARLAETPLDATFAEALQDAVSRTNADVHREAHSGDPATENMGSTVVVALVADGHLQVGHVGDSRAYLYRKQTLRVLTRDHTRVQQMLDAGMLTPEQAQNHPEGHVLSRAIGSKPEVTVEVGNPIPLEPGDALLLCSDGLSGYVGDDQIGKVLKGQTDVQRIPTDLVNLALASGGADNVTVQFVRIGTQPNGAVPPDGGNARLTAPLPLLTTLRVSQDASRFARNAALSALLSGVAILLVVFWARGGASSDVPPQQPIPIPDRPGPVTSPDIEFMEPVTPEPPTFDAPGSPINVSGEASDNQPSSEGGAVKKSASESKKPVQEGPAAGPRRKESDLE